MARYWDLCLFCVVLLLWWGVLCGARSSVDLAYSVTLVLTFVSICALNLGLVVYILVFFVMLSWWVLGLCFCFCYHY